MKLNRNELIVLGVIIVYIAFFTHPAPAHIANFLESPMGHIVALLGIAYVLVYQSFIVGIFLGIAYIMTTRSVTEYMDEKQQSPEGSETPAQPISSGVPPPAVLGAMKDLLKKGDVRLPQTQGKTETTKPMTAQQPKATHPDQLKGKVESFCNF
jgi:MFS superfamily sulfate permease-like transporter